MADSIEEIISRSMGESINMNDSCELNKLITSENDSLNVLKSIKEHLEGQGILKMLFQIQKEIYSQTCEKLIQDYMSNEFANKITTLEDLKDGIETFVGSFQRSFNKLNSSILSVIAKKHRKDFFSSSQLSGEDDITEKRVHKLEENKIESPEKLKSESFYSELSEKELIKCQNESTILNILASNDIESSRSEKDQSKEPQLG